MAGDALDDRVRRKLVTSLYSQPASLALGAACGVTGAGVVVLLLRHIPSSSARASC